MIRLPVWILAEESGCTATEAPHMIQVLFQQLQQQKTQGHLIKIDLSKTFGTVSYPFAQAVFFAHGAPPPGLV